VVWFGSFQLDLRSGELRREGVPVKLQPQPAKILVLLVSRAGEILTRAEIADQVWGAGTFVDFDHGLNYAIRQIRSALDDNAEQPRFLETLPKRGYRFIARVEGVGESSAGEKPAETPTGDRSDQKSGTPPFVAMRRYHVVFLAGALAIILLAVVYLARKHDLHRPTGDSPIALAVLPFDDLSPDPEPYIVEGLTEEMISRLTRINPQRLKVIARTSAMQYARTNKSARQIGRELGVDYILENSIRHEGGKIRVTAQLVRTADQTHLWAETYERDLVQLLPLESEVTENIAEQIHVQLLAAAGSTAGSSQQAENPEAHQLYLKARYFFNLRSRDGLDKSLKLYEQALEKEPSYAAAYAGLADSYNMQAFYGFDPTLQSVAQAKIMADKALAIDDTVGAAHAALAYTEFMYRQNWVDAGREFRRALELDDNYVPAHQWYALYLAAQGRMEEALAQMEFAQRIDPLSAPVHAGLGYMEYLARNYEQAIIRAQLALQLNPNLMAAHAVLGWSYIEQKKFPEAISALKIASKLSGEVPVYRSSLGRAYALAGDKAMAKRILAEMEKADTEARGVGTALAALRLAVGDSERALHLLESSATGDIQANWLRVDPAFDSIRTDSRFMAVIARLGEPQAADGQK